jgi:transposase
MTTKKKKNKPRGRVRRKFTNEFKADVVRLCLSGDESVAEVSRRLDLTESAVRHWVEQARSAGEAGASDSATKSEQEELVRLRREVKQLRMEGEILKKAATFFAKENS